MGWIALRSWLGTEARRAAVLAALVAGLYAVLGSVRAFAPAAAVGESPVNLDLALRTVALGWFEPSRTVPVTLVDIDDETYRGWGTPVVTPRGELARLLATVTAAGPAAVMLDIDLSWGGGPTAADAGDAALRDFLVAYRGPAPLVLPKRLEAGDDGRRAPAASPLDPVVAANAHLHWAHAAFETDSGGAVRHWSPWLAACAAPPGQWLPAVATLISSSLGSGAAPEPAAEACASPFEPTRRLLVGPRLTGAGAPLAARDAHSIPASFLLDPELARDDARLFGGRVVLIGATHASAGDQWLTPAGVYPGVELLAHSVRFAPLQEEAGPASGIALRAKGLLFFALFCAAAWWLRGVVALAAALLAALLVVAVAAGGFGDLAIFDALEAGILLTVAWHALRALADLAADWRELRREEPEGARGWFRTLRAVCVRQD